jgi:uncharacterized protein (DUF697 family)
LQTLLQRTLMPPLRRHWPLGLGLGGGLLLLESAHGPLSSLLSLSAAAAGLWLLSARLKPRPPQLPTSVAGWLERCDSVLASFERLQAADPEGQAAQAQRHLQLEQLRSRDEQGSLRWALVGCTPWGEVEQAALLAAVRSPLALSVIRSHPLPEAPAAWSWPEAFRHSDLVLYRLQLPLKAADLRWLEALPQGQPVALLVDRPSGDWPTWQQQLRQQLPAPLAEHCWPWSPAQAEGLAAELEALQQWWSTVAPEQLQRSQRRCLEELHGQWQGELEALRRLHWQRLLQRTQWTVAAGVVMAPLPSLDLLVLAAANGLMLQEMAQLWECPWSLDQLQAAAAELGKAALTQGVVEWSSQSLAALVKLHGATWLVGGALQALSAAYLTRVVGRAMADYLALAAGVPEAELQALLQQQAPLLVAQAAEAEKLNWGAFLQQGRQWLQQQGGGDSPVLQSIS